MELFLFDSFKDVIESDQGPELYKMILNKFIITITEDKYEKLNEYHERVFDLIENLREQESDVVEKFFDSTYKHNYYLVDNIIMMWCLPRVHKYRSKTAYLREYLNIINQYQHKIIDIITNQCVSNFCVEMLSKHCNIPTHCLDYIWFYMANMNIDLSFSEERNGDYLTLHPTKENTIDITMHIPTVLNLGIGKIILDNTTFFNTIIEPFLKPGKLRENASDNKTFLTQITKLNNSKWEYLLM